MLYFGDKFKCNLENDMSFHYFGDKIDALLLSHIYIFQGRELLLRISEVFVIKFKTIAKVQLPLLLSKWYKILWFQIMLFFLLEIGCLWKKIFHFPVSKPFSITLFYRSQTCHSFRFFFLKLSEIRINWLKILIFFLLWVW